MTKNKYKHLAGQPKKTPDQLRYEIASDTSMQLQNGTNGENYSSGACGEITKNLVALGEQQLKNQNK